MDSPKHLLHAQCLDYARRWRDTVRQTILEAQHSANEETKSSSGDKYETGRAMAQLEIEKNARQLIEAEAMVRALGQINPGISSPSIQPGSWVTTNHGMFFIAVAAGQLKVAGKTCFAVSPSSPIARQLMGLHTGEKFIFNGQEFSVQHVE